MKRLLIYTAIVLIFMSLLSGCGQKNDSISDKLIRFHVIANSDSAEDQSLKLKVRDKVLKDIGPKMVNSSSKTESQNILNANIQSIKTIAANEIQRNGKRYDVAVVMDKSSFPTKAYSNIVLPAGEYDALKITIGKGEGKNWWCVMFPPLCFIDITHGVTTEDTESELKTVLDDGEYTSILAGSTNGENREAIKKPIEPKETQNIKTTKEVPQKVEMKFKTMEILDFLFQKIGSLFNVR